MKILRVYSPECLWCHSEMEQVFGSLGYTLIWDYPAEHADISICDKIVPVPTLENKPNFWLYGESSKNYPEIIKSNLQNSNLYIMGHMNQTDNKHLYLPLYMVHALSTPLYNFSKLIPEPENRDFASFCASSNAGKESYKRIEFVEKLDQYRPVHCGGKIMHNYDMDNDDHIDFFRNHKFNICFENVQEESYITEKILNAFLSDTIPVYYGAPNIAEHFNSEAFINANNGFDEAIKQIKYLNSHPKAYLRMLREPMFTKQNYEDFENRLNNIPQWISEVLQKYDL